MEVSLLIINVLNRVLEILFLLLSPLFCLILWRKGYWGALFFGATDSQRGILIHAASVGEVNAAKPLIAALRAEYPRKKIVLTTTSLTGLKNAAGTGYPAHLAALDLAWLRLGQLRAIDPGLIIIVETEIWPNLLLAAAKREIPVVFVNARLKEKSLRSYLCFPGLWRHLARPVKAILAQSAADAARFRQLFGAEGVSGSKVTIDVGLEASPKEVAEGFLPSTCEVIEAGNLKYAVQLPVFDTLSLRARYGYSESDFILCFGSTRPGEEALIRDILPELQAEIPSLKLIIAPRHPQRIGELHGLFSRQILHSALDGKQGCGEAVLMVDSIGHLAELYALCDLAVVGGSFSDYGGHNPLEPAYYGKPVLIGPHHSSCAALVQELVSWGGILVTDAGDLASMVIDLYRNPDKRGKMGNSARECLRENGLSLSRHLDKLRKWLN